MDLRERLIHIQSLSKQSDRKFGQRLGVTGVMWFNIRTGKRGIGPKVLAGVMREFPELKPLVTEYLTATNPAPIIAAVA